MDATASAAGAAAIPPEISWPDLEAMLHGRRPLLFLDYDGTLTPIAERPDLANLSEETRALVADLAKRMPVAILTGRDIDDTKRKVALDDVIYICSHGFDVEGPGITGHPPAADHRARDHLHGIGQEVEAKLSAVPGVILENKRFSVAIHYRLVPEDAVAPMLAQIRAIADREPSLRLAEGKKLVELRPDVDWDKGTALLWTLENLGLDGDDVMPLFFGDDITDEDGFRALRESGRGYGIVVCDPPRISLAHGRVKSVETVIAMLRKVLR